MEQNFRGKVKTDVEGTGEELLFEKGQWAYGNLIWNNGAPLIVGGVVDWDSEYIALDWWVAVDPETVGIWTGLSKENKDIFTEDILEYKTGVRRVYGIVRFGKAEALDGEKGGHQAFYIEWQNDGENAWVNGGEEIYIFGLNRKALMS